MFRQNSCIKRILPAILFVLAVQFSIASYAEKPIVTDEYDRFLVTKNTKIGDRLGEIELVFENPLKTTWSLVKPVPGGDRRRYLKEGQLDATEIVEIDPDTAELRLKAIPPKNPAHYYAEVRATNKDGWMEQVLIIIALPETPKAEDALDIFTQRKEGGGIGFYGTERVDPKKVEYAANVAKALLMKDRRAGGRVTEFVKQRKAVMTLFYTFEERNTSIGFYMHRRSTGIRTQDLEDEEIIPDYLRLGGPRNIRRDASVEEITHLIHGSGIKKAYPGVQKRLEYATQKAVERGFYKPQDGLPADSYNDEFLAFGLDILYGVRSHTSHNGIPLTPENLNMLDPELYDILSFLFPSREEFFKEMGWEDDLVKKASIIKTLDDPSITISDEAKEALRSVGFTKCAMPFGVFLGADKDMPDAYVETAINVVAELIDPDKDGEPNDLAVLSEITKYKERAWLAMPMDQEKWREQLSKLNRVLGYDIIIPKWWMRVKDTGPDKRARAVIVEEVSHFMMQFGFCIVYPEQFGVEDWSSVIARETKRAGCDWWQHPENDCPGSPGTDGDCSGPSCDALEFYQQVATMRAGMEPGWLGIGFPKTKEELEKKLSQEIKDVMDDPQYNQISRPLTFDYCQTVGTSFLN